MIWGTTWAAIKIGLEGIPPFTAAAARFSLGGVVLLSLVPLLKVRLGAEGARERRLWYLNGFFSFAVSFGVVYWAEQYIPSGLAAILFALFPIFVAVLAHFFLPEERLGAWAFGGLLVAFAGVAVIFSEDLEGLGGPMVPLGAAVMLLSPLASAIGNVAVKRWGRGIHPVSIAAMPMLLSAAVLGTVAAVHEPWQQAQWTARTLGSVLYLAVIGSAVTFGLYFWLMTRLPATRLALLAYLTPIVATVVGTFYLGEPLTGRTVVGAALIVAGVFVATWLARYRASA